jgi:hypothetical protein
LFDANKGLDDVDVGESAIDVAGPLAALPTKGTEQQTHADASSWNFGGVYAFANRRASRSVGNWNDTHLRFVPKPLL